MASFFGELSLVVVLTFLISLFVSKLKQPLIIGYLITGIIVSPLFLDVLVEKEGFIAFSHIGISILLFLVGLQLNIRLIKNVGFAAVLTGIGQILTTAVLTVFISTILGYGLAASVIIAISLSFSSTIVIVKFLTDSDDISRFFGQVSLGFLLVQDFVAAVILVVLSTQIRTGNLFSKPALLDISILAVGVLSAVLILKRILPLTVKLIKEHEGLLFLFTISWCFGFASLFEWLGFSLEVGALLSGVLLASYPAHERISHKIIALKDFFLVIFFMFLGYELMPDLAQTEVDFIGRLTIALGVFSDILPDAVIFSAIVLVGNPIIVYTILRLLKHQKKNSLFAGFTVSQISEFSIIIGLLAVDAKLIGQKEVTTITTVALITIVCSTYLYILKERIYERIEEYLF